MAFKISSFQYSERSEYMRIQTGAQLKSSSSGLNLAFQLRRYRPAELKKYSPPSKMRVLSSRQVKIAVKKPLVPSYRVTGPLGFHLEAIHPCRALSVGQKPRNLPMNAWSLIYWISLLICSLGRSILILSVDLGMHVAEEAFGFDEEAFVLVLLSFVAAWPASAVPSLSVTGSVWRASLGMGPEPLASLPVAGISA